MQVKIPADALHACLLERRTQQETKEHPIKIKNTYEMSCTCLAGFHIMVQVKFDVLTALHRANDEW